MSDTGRNKTVVTAISKISDRPVAKEACLVVIYGLELGKKFNLNRPQIIIGRSSKADIQIDQEAVSRNHCKIINTGNAIMLRDMGSTNGTYVNDELIEEYQLRRGDQIKVGSITPTQVTQGALSPPTFTVTGSGWNTLSTVKVSFALGDTEARISISRL